MSISLPPRFRSWRTFIALTGLTVGACVQGCSGGSGDQGLFPDDAQADGGSSVTPPAADGAVGNDGTTGNETGVACPSGLTTCGGSCVDLKNDPAHCGDCAIACPSPGGTGIPACKEFQCTFTCQDGYHACGSVCTTNKSVATCGSSCTPCPTPVNGTPTCDGASCGATCLSGYHACGTDCAPNTSPSSCGASCTPCTPPTNATSTCDGVKCGFACVTGFHPCGATCADDTSPSTCGASCTPCPPPPPNGVTSCAAGACGFDCLFGYQKSGSSCVGIAPAQISLSSTVTAKVTGTFHLDTTVAAPRLEYTDVCPNGTITATVAAYQLVRVTNPTAQTATISVWTSLAATTGSADIDTIIASYGSAPLTDVQRKACSVGVNDACGEKTDPTECLGQWAGLTKTDGKALTVAPFASVYVYVSAFYGIADPSVHAGDYVFSVRTESLN